VVGTGKLVVVMGTSAELLPPLGSRVLVVGSGGAGKSTVSRIIAARTGRPTPVPDWRQRVRELIEQPTWVMDGNFTSTLDLRLPAADTVVFLDLLRAGRVGALSVSYFASAGAVWIPPVVATIAREFPRLRLDLRLIELLAADSGAPDVEIAVDGAESGGIAGYQVHPLLSEPYLAVVPVTSVLARRAQVDLAELRDQAWVDNDVARGPCRQGVLDACSTVGFSPAFHIETQDYPTAIRFVAEGMGITVIPRLGLGALPDAVAAIPIVNPTPRRSISVRVRDTAANHPAVIRMLELLDERVTVHHPAA